MSELILKSSKYAPTPVVVSTLMLLPPLSFYIPTVAAAATIGVSPALFNYGERKKKEYMTGRTNDISNETHCRPTKRDREEKKQVNSSLT